MSTATRHGSVHPWRHPAALAVLLMAAPGCIQPPDIVVEDRRSALEEQAAGRVRPVEARLERALVRPGPDALTSEQVAATGQGRLGALVLWADTLTPELDAIDRWLVDQCVGESLDGLLRETPATCPVAIDRVRMSAVLQRENRYRQALWEALAELSPRLTPDGVREAWRRRRLELAPCGCQLQEPEGAWGKKACP